MNRERYLFEEWCFRSGLVTNKRFFELEGQCDEVSAAWEAWNDRQEIIDQIEQIVRKERGHISYCETPRAKKMFKAILKAIGKPDPKEPKSNIDEWSNPLG